MNDLHQFAETIATEAAAIAMEGFRTGFKASKKAAIDLVTDYDLAAEKHIRGRIETAYPSHHIVGEEEGESGAPSPLNVGSVGSDAGKSPIVWYVDPIDGTTNFAHGHPFFCCSVACYQDGRGLVGVVVAPALGLTWSASVNSGRTVRNGIPCRVSETAELENALCATGFPYDRWTNDDNNVKEHAAMLGCTRGIRRCGSAALDLCLVADGTYDLYWEQRLSPWDMCGGAVIVEQAGGRLSDYDGSAADPRTGRLIASNGRLHAAVVEVLETARRNR